MLLASNGQLYGSKNYKLMLQDRFIVKNDYKGNNYYILVPDPIAN